VLFIIENEEKLEKFISEFHRSDCILIPMLCDHRDHPVSNYLLLLYIYILNNKNTYLFPINTNDCLNLSIETLQKILITVNNNSSIKYVFDKKQLYSIFDLDDKFVDLKLMEYVSTGQLEINYDELIPVYQFFYRTKSKFKNINRLIPVVKHIELLDMMVDKAMFIINKYKGITFELPFKSMNNIMVPVLAEIEKSRLYVNDEFSNKAIISNNYLYSNYNMFTRTSRPSCTYKGYNLVSIPKESNDRKSIESRFEDEGTLLLFDYDAYHLYLTAEIIGEKFLENPHLVLGRIYFGKNELTEEEYEESKSITWKLLYSGIPKEFLFIPMFKKINDFVNELWTAYKTDGFIYTKHFKRKLKLQSDGYGTPQKLYNYYIQALETENNCLILNELLSYYKNIDAKSKIVLYIYDSILLDMFLGDGINLINETRRILRYPTKIYFGKNYKEMYKI